MRRATENKILPTKYYWYSIGFILFIGLMTFFHLNKLQAMVFLPLALMIYFIGRHKQKQENPDMIG